MSDVEQFLAGFEKYDLPIHGVRMPEFVVEQEYKDSLSIKGAVSNFDFLRRLCLDGFKKLKLDKKSEEYKKYADRAKYELSVIEELGFTDYILLVWDVINFCHKNDIPCGYGRGCLTGESLVKTKNGLISLKDVKPGDHVVNKNGQWDEVLHNFEFDYYSNLLEFEANGLTYSSLKLTPDHEVLCVRNPFELDQKGQVRDLDGQRKSIDWSLSKKEWIPAKDVKSHDYLVRHVGRQELIKDIEQIDLAQYCDRFDENYIYETHAPTTEHPLAIRTIHSKIGISRNCLRSVKRQEITVQSKTLDKLNKYLTENGFCYQDFINYSSTSITKYNRYLKIDEDFCYALGFFIGDGWHSATHFDIGFAFHRFDNIVEKNKIIDYFTKLGCSVATREHKKKKLDQVMIKSYTLHKLFYFLVPDKGNKKQVPADFLNLPDHKLKGLLNGLLESDGSESENRLAFDNTSFKLIEQTRWLLEYFGYFCSINDRYQEGCNIAYKIHASPGEKTSAFIRHDDFVLLRVNKINEIENKSCKVYDLRIKNDPSYSTDKFIVHNSAAGSLVLFLIGVVAIDPVKYGLFFERFVSKIRAKKQVIDGVTYLDGSLAPDIDSDICYYKRPQVLEYLNKKFSGRVCKILTFNTLSSKLLIKECGKTIAGKTDDEMTRVTEMIPKLHGKIYTLEEAYNGIKDEDDTWKLEPVKQFVEWANENKLVYETALKLQDLIKNKGVHPSAMSISYDDLEEFTPTEFDSEKNEVSSYDMDWISLFNIKLDVLGLRGVSVVDDVCKQIGIKTSDINFEDPSIYRELQDLKCPHGIFQLEAKTNLEVSNKVKPKNLEELSAVISLARPGALSYVDQYAKYTNFGEYTGAHPFFDETLKKTGGLCLFQEQAMSMSVQIGFSKDEAEQIRRCIGKKKVEEIKTWKEKISNKIKENKLAPEIGDVLWKILEDSGGYQFNQSHSIAYASLSAATVYLKFHYPIQFFLSLLKMSRNEPDSISEISKIHKEMAAFGIQLLRPHILKSKLDFSIEGKDIRFGLLSIKGISDKSIEKLSLFCKEYASKFDIFEGANEQGLNIGVLCALIQAGTFEGFKQSRSKIVYEAQLWNILTDKEKKLISALAVENDYDLVKIVKDLSSRNDEKGKLLIKETRYATIKKNSEKYKAIYNMNSQNESFANWWYEKKLLGYTHGKTLKEIFIDKYPDLDDLSDVSKMVDNKEVYFLASVNENSEKRTSKAGNPYLTFDVSDETGGINVKVFSRQLPRCEELNNGATPKEDDIVLVYGVKKDGKCIFAEEYIILTSKIYTKLADLRKEEREKELTKPQV